MSIRPQRVLAVHHRLARLGRGQRVPSAHLVQQLQTAVPLPSASHGRQGRVVASHRDDVGPEAALMSLAEDLHRPIPAPSPAERSGHRANGDVVGHRTPAVHVPLRLRGQLPRAPAQGRDEDVVARGAGLRPERAGGVEQLQNHWPRVALIVSIHGSAERDRVRLAIAAPRQPQQLRRSLPLRASGTGVQCNVASHDVVARHQRRL
mmetsp:Transcript_8576/g.23275  ORF Transcript_8576/g.23275 Transcript_8576/m.23275 type:complete len:206 (-) Transcript_8576:113-730(-)